MGSPNKIKSSPPVRGGEDSRDRIVAIATKCGVPLAACALSLAFLWSYWPTILHLVDQWSRQPDYSHGFIVPPLAGLLLWMRRDHFPGFADRLGWPGLVLIAVAGAIRGLSAWAYFGTFDGWSMPIWIAGAVWLLCGRKVLVWSLPAIVFLVFMVPMPYRAEIALSYPLQRIATKVSCFALQCLGQPAIAEGNTILLGGHHLEVEQACSGLRIFMGTVALAFFYAVLVRRGWWERALMLLATVPVALTANAVRIVSTGILIQHISAEAGKVFAHDLAGWMMIPLAAALFGVVLLYIRWLVRDVEQADVRYLLRARLSTS